MTTQKLIRKSIESARRYILAAEAVSVKKSVDMDTYLRIWKEFDNAAEELQIALQERKKT